MKRRSSRWVLRLLVAASAVAFTGGVASAQQLIIKGEFGNKGGVMPPPGLYAGMFGAFSWADELVGPNKNAVDGPNLNQYAFGPLVQYVSKFKLFGANYGALAAMPFANIAIDFPRLDVDDSTGIAPSQLWVVPVMLGWHIDKPLFLAPGGADIIAHYAFYAPTGRYTAGALNNTALGMWTNELSLRVTSYFSKDRKWHGSGSLFYDFNGKKEGLDWTTGNPFITWRFHEFAARSARPVCPFPLCRRRAAGGGRVGREGGIRRRHPARPCGGRNRSRRRAWGRRSRPGDRSCGGRSRSEDRPCGR